MRAKRIFILVIMLMLTMSLAACSVNGIIKKLTGGKLDIDDEGNIKIEDDDGTFQSGKNVKWDKEKMHGLEKPDFKLTTRMTTDQGTSYMFEDFDLEDYKKLVSDLKAKGYTYNTYESENIMFVASNKDGLGFSLTYDESSKTGSITATKGEAPNEDDQYQVGDQEWDSDKIGGLPDPGLSVTAYSHDDSAGEYYYILTGSGDHEAYIEMLIDLGYDDVIEETYEGENLAWTAKNSQGDEVSYLVFGTTITIMYKEG